MAASFGDDFASFLVGGGFRKGRSRGGTVTTTYGGGGRRRGPGGSGGRYGRRPALGSIRQVPFSGNWWKNAGLASTRGAGTGGGGGGGARRSRDLINAKANGGGAAKAGRAVRYLEKRKEKDQDLDKEKWRTLEPELGDKEWFLEAVRKREGKGREVSYMSLVISPERTDLEITPRELARMAEPWTRNQNGREVEHVGYVHDDTEHPHLHLLVARHYYARREMEQNKEATRGMIREIERERELERIPERAREPEWGREQELTRERERDSEKEPERDYGPER